MDEWWSQPYCWPKVKENQELEQQHADADHTVSDNKYLTPSELCDQESHVVMSLWKQKQVSCVGDINQIPVWSVMCSPDFYLQILHQTL